MIIVTEFLNKKHKYITVWGYFALSFFFIPVSVILFGSCSCHISFICLRLLSQTLESGNYDFVLPIKISTVLYRLGV